MKFITTVYSETIVFIIFLKLLFFSGGNAADNQSTHAMQYGEETNALISIDRVTNQFVTWKFMVPRKRRTNVADEQSTAQALSNNNEKTIKELISKRINDKMYDLQCTFAQLAKSYVEFIYDRIELDLIEEIQPLLNLNEMYINITLEIKDAFRKFGYQQPSWITEFLIYLREQKYSPKFYNGLKNIMDILTKVTNTSKCHKQILDNLIDYIEETHGEMTKHHSEFVYILTEEYNSDYIITWYLIGVQYLLYKNRSTLSDQKIPENPWSLIYNLKDKKLISNPYPITNINEDLKFFEKELRSIQPHINRGFLLMNLSAWNNPITWESIAMVSTKPEAFNMNYYRDLYGNFNTLSNKVMETLFCASSHYSGVHIKETLTIFKNVTFKTQDDIKKNKELIFKYFDIALMTLAAFYNANYNPPGSLVMLVTYLENVRTLYDDAEKFISSTTEILHILDMASWKCQNAALPKLFDVPLLEIQEEYKEETVQMHTSLHRELIAVQLDNPARANYVSAMYRNIMQIMYFLKVNSDVYQYSNHTEFRPSSWLFLKNMLFNQVILNKLRWDTLQYEKDISLWDDYSIKLLKKIRSVYNGHVINVYMRIKDLKIINSTISNLLAVVICRLTVSFLIQCKSITDSGLVYDSTKFVEECTGISEDTSKLLEISGLKEQDQFFSKLSQQLNIYENLVLKKNGDINDTKKMMKGLIEELIIRLHVISINENLEAHFPIVPTSCNEISLRRTAQYSVWRRTIFFKEMMEHLARDFTDNYKAWIDNKRVNKSFVNAIDNVWPYPASLKEFKSLSNQEIAANT